MARLGLLIFAAVVILSLVLTDSATAGKYYTTTRAPSPQPPPTSCNVGPKTIKCSTSNLPCLETTNFCDKTLKKCGCCSVDTDCDPNFHCYLGVCEQTPTVTCGVGNPEECTAFGRKCVVFPPDPTVPGSSPTVTCVKPCFGTVAKTGESARCYGGQTCQQNLCQ